MPTHAAVETATARPTTESRQARGSGTATVFGLDVHATDPLAFLQPSAAQPTGRALELSLAPPDAEQPRWPPGATVICDEREPGGKLNFRIESHPQAGYLLWGPRYGHHLISADGRRVLCLPGTCAEHEWQRLLIAQVLPFAALLHELEVFHASAVVHDGRATALMGPSRAGKTSLALELCRRGAGFLADDVLALEIEGETLLGHPGTPIAGVDHEELRRLAREGGEDHDNEALAVNARERIVRMRTVSEPAPLGAVFLLDRRQDVVGGPHFEPVRDAPPLLAATFNFVFAAPSRLRRLLEVCALAARCRVERVVLGPDVDAGLLAVAVERRLAARP